MTDTQPAGTPAAASIETLLDNEWLSLRVVRKPEAGVNGYVYSHESRCHGRIVAVLPYRVTAGRVEYLLKSEMTPCWGFDQVLSSITGGYEGGDIADDAVREMLEETGYTITRDELVPLGESYASKSADTVYTLFSVNLTGRQAGEAVGDGSRVEAESAAVWLTDAYLAGILDPQVAVMHLRLWRTWADSPEPSTPPAQPSGERRAAAGGHPGTLDGPGVLGRALLDRDGNAWPANDREWAESEYGPVREVLLVDPADLQATGRVLDGMPSVAALSREVDAAWRQLAVAFTEAAGSIAAAVDAYGRPTADADVNSTANNIRPEANGAPEPAGDGPGWEREAIHELIRLVRSDALSDDPAASREDLAQQAEALIADRDQLATALDTRSEQLHEALTEVDALDRALNSTVTLGDRRLLADLDAARAELAEARVTLARFAGGPDEVRAELAKAIEERDLAIAHDRQPYPTADAYEAVCATLERKRAELAEVRRDAAFYALRMAGAQLATRGNHQGADLVRGLALDIRDHRRPVPGSPQPAPDGGEETS